MYVRKTVDEWRIMAEYEQGWEEVCTEETRKAARITLKEYQENAPLYRYKIIKKRVKKGGLKV